MRGGQPVGPRLSPQALVDRGVTPLQITAALGTAKRRTVTVQELTVPLADRIACAVGLHPAQIWGEEWWRASEAEFELRSRWSVKPIYARGFVRNDIVKATGKPGILKTCRADEISRADARLVCAALGLDPTDVWDDWEWVSP
jgi:lambda repressor-like predicted transcriptional regulator